MHALTLIASLTALVVGAASASAQPYRPVDDATVLLTLSPGARPQSQGQPGDMQAALARARTAIDQGRRNGDPRKFGEAQAALAPWWDDEAANLDVLVLRAVIKQSLHAFAPALADLDKALVLKPGHIQARLTRAFIQAVTGEASAAAKDCAAITDPRARLIRSICEARVAGLTGKAAQAFATLNLHLASTPAASPALQHFANTVLAELATALGRDEEAERILRSLAAADPADVMTRASLCDLLIGTGRAAEAAALLEQDSESDSLLLRRAIAAKILDSPGTKALVDILSARFEAAALSGNRVHLREEARFNLEITGDLSRALELALANWHVQKEPADALLVLRAAAGSKNLAAAAPIREFIARTGLADHRLAALLPEKS